MARKRSDNKKWKSRPSRKKSRNRSKKPCQIRRNNSRLSRSTKPSRIKRKKIHNENNTSVAINLDTNFTGKLFDARIIQTFISNRYLSEVRQVWSTCECCMCEHPQCNMQPAKQEREKYHDCSSGNMICSFCYDFVPTDNTPFCSHSRIRNMMQIPNSPNCLILGFLEQRAVTLMHCYMSILIIRGSQRSMRGQAVHCPADIAENIGDLLPFPKCYEMMSVIQCKPGNNENELRTTVRYSVSAIQILEALEFLIEHHAGYKNKTLLSLNEIEQMFECRKEDVAAIRIIDSYAYHNATICAPIVNDSDDDFLGPTRTLKAGENPVWKIEPGMEECTFPWIYPNGEGGELEMKRPISIKVREYCKLRLRPVQT